MTVGSITPARFRAQDRLLRLLGEHPKERPAIVSRMLRRDASEATSYWLQLSVSVGIATLGLVVGSTAVVIGAMLVAPLMSPIVGLAMGLATGSPFLVLRASGRIAISVAVAVGGAAIITLLLPFHELNAEIAARTSPTVLDLVTAAFCALVGVYASLRPGSDTAATAAGTSIGISLVPPLCASGYGVGTAVWDAAGGAMLLFLTNLVAIAVVGTVAFIMVGFGRVDVPALELEELSAEVPGARISRAVARRLSQVFHTRWGSFLRYAMPFFLLAAVYIPLRRGLDEVAWEVRARAAVRESLAREKLPTVESRVRIERHQIDVVVVILGKTSDADAARTRLDAELRRLTGVVPRIEVLAVPDATAFAGLESNLRPHLPPPSLPVTESPAQRLDATRDRVRSAVVDRWPSKTLGEPLAIDLGTTGDSDLSIRVVHIGPTLGDDARETIQAALTTALARPTRIVDVAAPSAPMDDDSGAFDLLAGVAAGVRATAGVEATSVCVTRPSEKRPSELSKALSAVLASHPRVTTTEGDAWRVQFVAGTCPIDRGDAGGPDAGVDASPRN